MKKIYLLLALVMLMCYCSKKPIYTAKVNLVSSAEGTITLRSVALGKNELEAKSNAEKQLFKILFFKGIPNSVQENAMIPDEGKAMGNHKDFFKDFFENEKYKQYLMYSDISTPFSKSKKEGGAITVDAKVNLFSLRKELEKNNIIRKFGF